MSILYLLFVFFFFKQKTAYEIYQCDWSSDVCSSDLHPQPEIILNTLGDPYHLRKEALDRRLGNHELGRVLLHLVQRRGFLSNRKTLLDREMLDDPDVQAILSELEKGEDNSSERAKEETAFQKEIEALRQTIETTPRCLPEEGNCRTLGEYLFTRGKHECQGECQRKCQRNRSHEGRSEERRVGKECRSRWSPYH